MKRDPHPHEISFQHPPFQLPPTVSKSSFREFYVTSLLLLEILSWYLALQAGFHCGIQGFSQGPQGPSVFRFPAALACPESCFFQSPFLRHVSAGAKASPKTSSPTYVFGNPRPCLIIYLWHLYTSLLVLIYKS